MSAKKSFDLQRKGVETKKLPVRASAPKKTPAPPSRAPKQRASLRDRRQSARNAVSTIVFVVVALVLGAVVYGLWRPEVRISSIEARNVPDTEGASEAAASVLKGTYFGIIPRDSVFFYPEKEVREAVVAAYPSIVSASVTRTSFASLSISGTRRVAFFYWCGESASVFSVSGSSCFEADSVGFVFAPSNELSEASTSSPLLRIYAPLEGATAGNPIRGNVVGAAYIQNLFQFVKTVKTLGVPVLSTYIHGDEAELFVTPETRIMYVLGREEMSAAIAEAAFPNLNFLDGSIEYVDLRFNGKAYVKRYEGNSVGAEGE